VNALLVIHTNSYFANLFPVAELLRDAGWQPRILFASPYPTLERDISRARAAGIKVETWTHESGRLTRAVLAQLGDAAPVATAKLAATMRRVRRAIREWGVQRMILPADNRYDLAAYVRAAHDEGVPVVAIPAFMAAPSEWAQFVADDPDYQLDRLANRVAATLYPSWIHTHAGKQLVALPAGEILARQWLGIAPPQPWTLHSGHVDAIALESEALRHYCLTEGLPPAQLVLTGSIDHDKMFARLQNAAALRQELARTYRVTSTKPLAVTALPPDWLYGRGRPECEFREYRELVKSWIEPLAASFDVIVSLHPSVQRETMAYVEELGAVIASEPVSSLIPLCDVFVASVSATIQWAIACGKPVINYDTYRFRYPDYLGVGGVVHVEAQDDYCAVVARLAAAPERALLTEAQAKSAKTWGILDGNAGQRLIALIAGLTPGRRARPADHVAPPV
jgi:hypothetical protein